MIQTCALKSVIKMIIISVINHLASHSVLFSKPTAYYNVLVGFHKNIHAVYSMADAFGFRKMSRDK